MKFPEDFETNEELRTYTIQLIRQLGLCGSLKQMHPDAFLFFKSLFQRHPEKERKEVALLTDISIRKFPKASSRGPLAVSDHQFFLHKSNGTEDSISWNSCVKGEINPVEKRLNWAMRHAVESQISEFKQANKDKPCEFCGATSNLTADHIVKFKQLKDDFILLHPNYPTQFGKNSLAQEIFSEADAAYSQAWQVYHKTHATLRILCKPCNQKLDNYGADHV